MIFNFEENILVIGGTGFIGSYYCKYSNYKRRIYKTSSRQKKGFIKFDLLKDINKFKKIIEKYNINKVVFLSAVSNPQKCFENKKKSNLINVKYPKKIIDILVEKNIYFIFFSSEYIFKGKAGGYLEKNKPSPDLLYGKQKNYIEKYLMKKKTNNYSIFRISKVVGFKKNDGSLFSQFVDQLKNNKIIKIASNQIFNPLFVLDLIKVIDYFILKKISGKFNVCGDFKTSRYNFIKKFCNKLKIPSQRLQKVNLDFFTKYEKYPLNTSMINNKVKKITKIKFTKQSGVIDCFINKNKIASEKR